MMQMHNSESSLGGKVALVTGGTRGLGRVIARTLLAQGCTVVVCGRTPPRDTASGGGPAPMFLQADIRDPDQARKLVDDVIARHGRLDILVNNAGGSPPSDAATASPRFAQAIVALNLLAPLYLAQAAHAALAQAPGGGVIVNIASVAGTRPSPGTSVYGAAKAGLIHLGRSLAQEWGPHVRVNSIVVGLVATESVEETYGSPEAQARVARSLPAGRLGTGEDIAQAVLFLCSPNASYVSGAELTVAGGGERVSFLATEDA